ncbi:MAG: cytochrome-c peroxidase [Bacteroidota bacterium]
MLSKFIVSGITAIFFLSAATGDPITIPIPTGWPAPQYDNARNPLTAAGIALGRRLFYEPLLSRDSTVSCSNCHLSFTAFTHVDHALSHGINDRIGTRNSPALMNLAWSRSFMWDGAVNHLDMQALAPISNPAEMDFNIQGVAERLKAAEDYREFFEKAFGSGEITGERILKALAQFELTLVSANSRYDRVTAGKDTFTVQEKNGYELFLKHCNSCHTEPLFTSYQFENNGLKPDTTLNDHGRAGISGNQADELKFKVPTLRNIEISYPYMHDGRFKRLKEVLNHYTDGIEDSPTLSPLLKDKIQLGSREKTDLTAFLLTLTDREFLFNPEFRPPAPK